MKTPICERLGCEVPIFAFTHCRDVVVEVTKAGGFGVLGAVTHSPEQLERELKWIDEHVGGRPYGVDVLIPVVYDREAEASTEEVIDLIPAEQRQFVDKLLDAEGVPPLSADDAAEARRELIGRGRNTTPLGARRLIDVALRHPQVKLVVSALGAPPKELVDELHGRGILVGSLCGKAEHAKAQRAVGVDIIVAQGTEAGGHCGEVSTLVVVPEVIDAIDDSVPVLAAGGIVTGRQMAAAVALGAAGAWTGSVWLTTEEAETAPATKQKMLAATSRDTVRSAGRTGKPARQLVSDWTDAWAPNDGGRKPLPLPLQNMLSEPVIRRIDRLAAQGHPGAQQLATYFVGQGVGLMNKVKPAREVVREFIEDYLTATERLNRSLP